MPQTEIDYIDHKMLTFEISVPPDTKWNSKMDVKFITQLYDILENSEVGGATFYFEISLTASPTTLPLLPHNRCYSSFTPLGLRRCGLLAEG